MPSGLLAGMGAPKHTISPMTTETQLFKRTGGHPVIAYEVSGQGEVLMFLHGIGGNRRNWDGQLAHFRLSYRAVALDFRGYGDSESIGESLEFSDFVADTLGVLDALDTQRAHVVGLSMGGLVGQALYAQAPERVASLSLVACRSADEPLLPPARREAFIRERLEPLCNGGPAALARSLAPALIGKQASPEAREQVMASLRKIKPESYFKVMEARMRIAPFLDLSRIQVPVLVVGSDEDNVAPLAQMHQLASAIPGARLETIEGAGHLINLERPEEFNRVLMDFLHSVKDA